MTNRLHPRSIARQVNRKRTLPQRMLRELRWIWRDVQDFHAEVTRWSDKHVAGTPRPLAEAVDALAVKPRRQSEMNDPRDRADGNHW